MRNKHTKYSRLVDRLKEIEDANDWDEGKVCEFVDIRDYNAVYKMPDSAITSVYNTIDYFFAADGKYLLPF